MTKITNKKKVFVVFHSRANLSHLCCCNTPLTKPGTISVWMVMEEQTWWNQRKRGSQTADESSSNRSLHSLPLHFTLFFLIFTIASTATQPSLVKCFWTLLMSTSSSKTVSGILFSFFNQAYIFFVVSSTDIFERSTGTKGKRVAWRGASGLVRAARSSGKQTKHKPPLLQKKKKIPACNNTAVPRNFNTKKHDKMHRLPFSHKKNRN